MSLTGLGWLAVIPLLGILVFVHELGHFLAARLSGVRVEEFGFGLPPRAAVLFRHGGTIFSLNWLPLGGFLRMAGEESGAEGPDTITAQPPSRRLLVFAAGALMNLVLAIVIYVILFVAGTPVAHGDITIAATQPGSPAAKARLQKGDIIVAIDGAPTNSLDDTTRAISAGCGRDITLTILRDGGRQDVSLRSRLASETPEGQGALGVLLQIGGDVTYTYTPMPIASAITHAFRQVGVTAVVMLDGVGRLIASAVSPQVEAPAGGVSGPIGIARITGEIAQQGWRPYMELGAFLSLNFALINMFPFPGLDGGHIVFVIIEWLRGGKRISPTKEAVVHLVGLALLILLMLVVTYFDVLRWIQGGAAFPGG